MPFADSNLVAVRYSLETVWGETPPTGPGPTMQALRLTGESLAHDKTTLVSEEIRSDRQIPSVVQAGVEASGDIKFELSAGGSFDSLLQSALASANPTVITDVGLTLSVNSGAFTITRTAGSWIVDGFVVGQWVRFGGFTNATNNTVFRINTITATVLTVDDPEGNLVTEGPTAACTANGKMLRNGVTKRSHLIEKFFSDITQYIWFNGMRVNQMNLRFTARQRVTGNFTFIGKGGNQAVTSQSGAITAATTTDMLTASASVGKVREYIDTVPGPPTPADLPVILKEVSIDVKNNLRPQPVVGQKTLAGVGYGRFEVTGTFQVYFQDATILNQFLNHSLVSLSFAAADAAGNTVVISLPAIRLNKATPAAEAINRDVMLNADFEAQLDPNLGFTMQIDLL